jgi:hypothetical protein
MAKKLIPIAIAYDFDGTLAPGNMQEHQFLPDIGITKQKFWKEVKELSKTHQADEVLVYMNLMLKKASASNSPVRKEDFKKCGEKIVLFDGVDTWFDRVNSYAKTFGTKIDHYLISSGNEEIFAGTKISKKFTKVYASKFIFNQNGVADWPALAINYTTKTQYLFRINKGAHDLSDHESVNKFVNKKERPVPFENMVFIGDGATDIPCFRLIKDQGGLSIAVYKQNTKDAKAKADKYLKDSRVHVAVPANYKEGSDLENIIKKQINNVVSRYALNDLLEDKI